MKIAFLGDSITEGIHGSSYVELLEEAYPEFEVDNYGKGGNTVKSIFKRIQKIGSIGEYDLVFLFVGVNDILGKLSWFYKFLKIISNQPASKDASEFQKYYEKTLDYLCDNANKVVVLPPLVLGEKLDNKWNLMISELIDSINIVLDKFKSVDFIDIRKEFLEYLSSVSTNTYLPTRAIES